jgi:RNA polymerase sigma-70 factor, ECF subfamily
VAAYVLISEMNAKTPPARLLQLWCEPAMSDHPKSASFDLLLPATETVARDSLTRSSEEEVTALFEHFRGRLIRYLSSLGLPTHDGEEIVQEVFLSLYHHLQENKSRRNLRAWIFRVAHNLGLKKRTENGSLKLSVESEQSPAEQFRDPSPSPEEQIFFRQRQRRLMAVVEALPLQDRNCLYLRAEGLRYREIAQVLDISLGGVSQSLARAIKRLSEADYR